MRTPDKITIRIVEHHATHGALIIADLEVGGTTYHWPAPPGASPGLFCDSLEEAKNGMPLFLEMLARVLVASGEAPATKPAPKITLTGRD